MGRTRAPYPAEFRARMVELVRAGRTPEELSREFEPTAQSISNWVGQAGRDQSVHPDGLPTDGHRGVRHVVSRCPTLPGADRGFRHAFVDR